MNIKIIIPFFGELPDYFDFFLESCRYNSNITFFIFSDQKMNIQESNIKCYYMTFEEFINLAKNKIDFNIEVSSPYKLCDYKPLYGKIFEDYLKETDFWGHCDVDLIFGNIFNLISKEILLKYDKIQCLGHFILYRNNDEINNLYKTKLENGIPVEKVLNYKEPCFFDEVIMPIICNKCNIKQYIRNKFADILPQYNDFVISPICTVENKENQLFFWEKGKLYQQYIENNEIKLNEIMYIHLQKRFMNINYTKEDLNNRIYITPQGFIPERIFSANHLRKSKTQRKNYYIKKIKGFSLRKIWIKLKIVKLKNIIMEEDNENRYIDIS